MADFQAATYKEVSFFFSNKRSTDGKTFFFWHRFLEPTTRAYSVSRSSNGKTSELIKRRKAPSTSSLLESKLFLLFPRVILPPSPPHRARSVEGENAKNAHRLQILGLAGKICCREAFEFKANVVASTKPVSVNKVSLTKKRKLRMTPPPRNVVLPLPKQRRVGVAPVAKNSTAGRRIVTKKAIRADPSICAMVAGNAEMADQTGPIFRPQLVGRGRVVSKKAKRARPNRRERLSSKLSQISEGVASDSGLAKRLIGGSHTMLRAVVPRQNLELGFCKPEPRSIFLFLKNCVLAGHLEHKKHIEILELFARVQGLLLRKPNHEKSLERFYINLATCSAFEEEGIQRMVAIMMNTLSFLSQ